MSANNDADNALLPDLIDDLPDLGPNRRTTGVAELPVYYESRVVGTIEVHAEGPSFTYAPEWLSMRGAFPISLLMPLSPRRVPPRLFLPWAANLLPEATQLKAIGLQLGASPADVIGILSELGRDTAGALSIGEPGTANPPIGARCPDDKALERILAELPSKPFLVGEDGVSMSLAGVQTKLGVAIDDKGRICVPINGAPSTWILKPDSERLLRRRAERGAVPGAGQAPRPQRAGGHHRQGGQAHLPDGQALRPRRAVRAAGAACTRRISARRSASRRRRNTRSNQTGIPGPTLAEMFAVTRNAMQAPDVVNLLDYVIFNVLACNTDAHAKNYSLMISGKGFRLAPIYDVMCAQAWEHVTRNMAQKIAGKSRGEHLKRRHWQRFAADVGLNAPRLIARVEALAKAALVETRNAAADVAAMPAGAHPLMQQVTEAIEGRARALLSGLTEDEPAERRPAEAASRRSRSASRRARARARAPPEVYFAAAYPPHHSRTALRLL